MPTTAETYAGRIHAIMPDLVMRSAVYDDMGAINDVVIVNDHLVFRFAKAEHDFGVGALANELRVLAAIRPYLTLAVPDPFYVSADAIAYELLPGESLTRDLFLSLDAPVQQAVADQIAGFLRALHTMPIGDNLPPTRAPVRRADWLDLRRQVETTLYPLFQPYQVAWANNLFDDMLADPRAGEYDPRLINGDLAPYHLLYNRALGRLTGVIDWGMAGLGDPANDLGWLLQLYGRVLVKRLFKVYPEARRLLPRARFYTQALELEWMLRGLSSGQTFWFGAHLAGARDLLEDEGSLA